MKIKFGFIALSISLILAACSGPNSEYDSGEMIDNENAVKTPTGTDRMADQMPDVKVMEKEGIKVYPYTASPTFEDASLTTTSPKNGANVKAGKVKFTYDVKNYELGAQTSDATQNGLANSGDGQHIHAILNNEPYMAHYKPEFEKDLQPGNYVLLSFLSRSYHESLKNKAAMDLIQFTVGDAKAEPIDLDAPHLFYSRPKGTYKGEDTNKLLLDFYLVNCELSPDGYKVRATINGSAFTLTDWTAYVVEGLGAGENAFKLELLDGDGNLVKSPYNPSERTIILEK